jgi:hypothetical protein
VLWPTVLRGSQVRILAGALGRRGKAKPVLAPTLRGAHEKVRHGNSSGALPWVALSLWGLQRRHPAASSSELNRRNVGVCVREKLGLEIGPQLQQTQPNSLDAIGSIRPDSPCWTPSG